MSLNKEINKIQFRIDHLSLAYRVGILLGMLFIIFIPWFILIYQPQAQAAAQIRTDITALQEQTQRLQRKYANVLGLAKSHNMDQLIVVYNDLVEKKRMLTIQTQHFQQQYISDADLDDLLHDILKDISGIKIEHFSVVTKEETVASHSASTLAKTPKPPPASPAALKNKAESEATYYLLTLKGDYFAIMRFLQRIEQIKWQLFWVKLDYKVQQYPIALASIEFYTLTPVTPSVPAPVNQGAAK